MQIKFYSIIFLVILFFLPCYNAFAKDNIKLFVFYRDLASEKESDSCFKNIYFQNEKYSILPDCIHEVDSFYIVEGNNGIIVVLNFKEKIKLPALGRPDILFGVNDSIFAKREMQILRFKDLNLFVTEKEFAQMIDYFEADDSLEYEEVKEQKINYLTHLIYTVSYLFLPQSTNMNAYENWPLGLPYAILIFYILGVLGMLTFLLILKKKLNIPTILLMLTLPGFIWFIIFLVSLFYLTTISFTV